MEDMANKNPSTKEIWNRLYQIGKPFWVSECQRSAIGKLVTVITLMFISSSLTVYAVRLTGDATSALQREDFQALWYIISKCAGALGMAALATSFFEFYRSSLAYNWREWLTKYYFHKYFSDSVPYKMAGDPRVENAGQRMTQVLESWVNAAVGLSLSATNAVVDICLFLGQLIMITWLLGAAVFIYSALGSVIMYLIGRKLVPLNLELRHRDAALREYLDDVNRDAESIAIYNSGASEERGATSALVRLMATLRSVMYVNRRLSFFSTPYTLLMPLIPTIAIAHCYVHSTMQIGVVGIASLAFAKVFKGMTVIVDQFAGITFFLSDTHRLGAFEEVMDEIATTDPEGCKIKIEASSHVEAKNLSVLTPDGRRVLVDNGSFSIANGSRVLILGASGCGKSSLLRALLGLPVPGSGIVSRPARDQIMVIPQRPYLREGTLREALVYPNLKAEVSDVTLLAVLKLVGLADLAVNVGGLNASQKWNKLSLGQQQQISLARVFLARPKTIILDEATSAIDPIAEKALHRKLQNTGATIISTGHRPALVEYNETIIEFTNPAPYRQSECSILKMYPASEFDAAKWSRTHES